MGEALANGHGRAGYSADDSLTEKLKAYTAMREVAEDLRV